MAQFFQRRGRGFQMRTRRTSSSASNSTERVLNRSATVVSVTRRCRLCFGRFATTLELRLFQRNRPLADMRTVLSDFRFWGQSRYPAKHGSRRQPQHHQTATIATTAENRLNSNLNKAEPASLNSSDCSKAFEDGQSSPTGCQRCGLPRLCSHKAVEAFDTSAKHFVAGPLPPIGN